MASPIRLDHVVARNLRELIDERELRHADVAALMQGIGFDWTTNRVAQVATLRRSISREETAGLCLLFRVPQDRLLAGDDVIELSAGKSAPLQAVREALTTGRVAGVEDGLGWTSDRVVVGYSPVPDDVDASAARRLGIELGEFQAVMSRLYHVGYIAAERDRRVGDTAGLSAGAIRAKRGHAMRAILDEMRAGIEDLHAEKAKLAAHIAANRR